MFEVIYLKHTTYTTALKKCPKIKTIFQKNVLIHIKPSQSPQQCLKADLTFFLKEQWFILPESIIHIIIILVWHHQ